MNKYLHIRIDEKLKTAAERVAAEKGLKLSDYIRMLLTEKTKESVKMTINLNLDNVNKTYEITDNALGGTVCKYNEMAKIIHYILDENHVLEIRDTEDCFITTLIDYLEVEWFEIEDDVLYIR